MNSLTLSTIVQPSSARAKHSTSNSLGRAESSNVCNERSLQKQVRTESQADSSSSDKREEERAIRSKASTETPREQCLTIGAALSWDAIRSLAKGPTT